MLNENVFLLNFWLSAETACIWIRSRVRVLLCSSRSPIEINFHAGKSVSVICVVMPTVITVWRYSWQYFVLLVASHTKYHCSLPFRLIISCHRLRHIHGMRAHTNTHTQATNINWFLVASTDKRNSITLRTLLRNLCYHFFVHSLRITQWNWNRTK